MEWFLDDPNECMFILLAALLLGVYYARKNSVWRILLGAAQGAALFLLIYFWNDFPVQTGAAGNVARSIFRPHLVLPFLWLGGVLVHFLPSPADLRQMPPRSRPHPSRKLKRAATENRKNR